MVAHVGYSTHALPVKPTICLRHVRGHGSVTTLSLPQMISLTTLASKSVVFVVNKETSPIRSRPFQRPGWGGIRISATQFALAQTPIKVEVLEKWLNGYNHMDSFNLCNGFKYDFRLNYEGISKEKKTKVCSPICICGSR